MSELIIFAKALLTIGLSGVVISSLFKLSQTGRNPEIAANVEIGVGIFRLIFGVAGLYYVWVVW